MPSTSSPAAANKVALAMASSARFTASDEPSGTSSITTPSPEERRPHQPPPAAPTRATSANARPRLPNAQVAAITRP